MNPYDSRYYNNAALLGGSELDPYDGRYYNNAALLGGSELDPYDGRYYNNAALLGGFRPPGSLSRVPADPIGISVLLGNMSPTRVASYGHMIRPRMPTTIKRLDKTYGEGNINLMLGFVAIIDYLRSLILWPKYKQLPDNLKRGEKSKLRKKYKALAAFARTKLKELNGSSLMTKHRALFLKVQRMIRQPSPEQLSYLVNQDAPYQATADNLLLPMRRLRASQRKATEDYDSWGDFYAPDAPPAVPVEEDVTDSLVKNLKRMKRRRALNM